MIKEGVDWDALDPRIRGALRVAWQFGQEDGAHHKMWVIDQMTRSLLEGEYDAWVEDYENVEEDEDDQCHWDTGIAP